MRGTGRQLTRLERLSCIAALVGALVTLIWLVQPATAAAPTPFPILVMGDSYSAGNGAGAYYGAKTCRRSHNNYAEQYARGLNAAHSNQRAYVMNVACSGATTDAIKHGQSGQASQLDAVRNGHWQTILLTLGGNDLNFSNIVSNCLIRRSHNNRDCGKYLTAAETLIHTGSLESNVYTALHAVGDAVAQHGDTYTAIVLLGYPYLEGNPHYNLVGRCSGWPHSSKHHNHGCSIHVGARLKRIEDNGDLIEQRVIGQLNAQHVANYVFVKTKKTFAGHELYAEHTNPHRWLIQPFVDVDSTSYDVWYHPNFTGWQAEANLLLGDTHIPQTTPTTGPTPAPAPGPAPKPTPAPNPPPGPAPAPGPGSGTTGATAISTGAGHSCALLANRTVTCWGSNTYGQLGNGTTTDSSTPVAVAGINSATAISAGTSSTCALMTNGTAECWGANGSGQLGNGTTSNSSTPVAVGLTGVVAVAVGGDFACAVLRTGHVYCWGYSFYPSTGNVFAVSTPTAIEGISNATAVTAGSGGSCALLADHTVDCWTDANGTPPAPVPGLKTATAITYGNGQGCALLPSGTVACWNGNDGTTSVGPIVSGISNATEVTTGWARPDGQTHTCALVGGNVDCWGSNGYGQLGDGTTVSSGSPVTVPGASNATSIAAGNGGGDTCAALTDGGVRCWGHNDLGQLGNGTTTSSPTAVSVIGIP